MNYMQKKKPHNYRVGEKHMNEAQKEFDELSARLAVNHKKLTTGKKDEQLYKALELLKVIYKTVSCRPLKPEWVMGYIKRIIAESELLEQLKKAMNEKDKWFAQDGTVYMKDTNLIVAIINCETRAYMNMENEQAEKIAEILNK